MTAETDDIKVLSGEDVLEILRTYWGMTIHATTVHEAETHTTFAAGIIYLAEQDNRFSQLAADELRKRLLDALDGRLAEELQAKLICEEMGYPPYA